MDNFEQKALKQATHKPLCWFRYVDESLSYGPTEQKSWSDSLTI
jgi:hypothetical protein